MEWAKEHWEGSTQSAGTFVVISALPEMCKLASQNVQLLKMATNCVPNRL